MTNVLFLLGLAVFMLVAITYLPWGIVLWLWIALQSPQQLLVSAVQVNLLIAVICVLALATNRKRATVWVDGTLFCLLLFLVHTAITTALGYVPEYSYPYFDRLWKTLALAAFICLFMQNRTRVQAIVWTIVLSLGMLAVKTGIFSMVTMGQFRVWGPPGSQITDNNQFAGALCMVIPFIVYLHRTTADSKVRMVLMGMLGLLILAVLFTYSRGGLLALIAVSACYMIRARRKILIAGAAAAVLLIVVPMMPGKWLDRMQTISDTASDTEAADESVRQRFEAWHVYSQIAFTRPLIGGGFRAPEVLEVWRSILPVGLNYEGRAAHNSFFQVLGEHGFLGLGIYLTLILLFFKNVTAILHRARYAPELAWIRHLAGSCAISMVGYLAAGLTVSICYYDLFFILLILAAGLRRTVVLHLAANGRAPYGPYRPPPMPDPALAPARYKPGDPDGLPTGGAQARPRRG